MLISNLTHSLNEANESRDSNIHFRKKETAADIRDVGTFAHPRH